MTFVKTVASFLLMCVAWPADKITQLAVAGLNRLNPGTDYQIGGNFKPPRPASGSAITSEVTVDGQYACIHLEGFLDVGHKTQNALDQTLVEVFKSARSVHQEAVDEAEQASQGRTQLFAQLKTGATSQLTVGTPPVPSQEPAQTAPPAQEPAQPPAPKAPTPQIAGQDQS